MNGSIGRRWTIAFWDARTKRNAASVIAEGVGGDPGNRSFAGRGAPPRMRRPVRIALLGMSARTKASPAALDALQGLVARLTAEGVELVTCEQSEPLREFEHAMIGIAEKSFSLLDWELRWPLGTYRDNGPSGLSLALLDRLAACEALMTVDAYEALLGWRDRLREQAGSVLQEFDCALTLSATGAAPQASKFTGDPALNIPASTLGLPAVSLPVLSCEGLPLGAQLIGQVGHDVELLQIVSYLILKLGMPKGCA